MTIQHDKITAYCNEHSIIRNLVHDVWLFDKVDSTGRIASEIAVSGHPGGIIILADSQDQGTGRMDRAWFSPPGVNVYLSFYFLPNLPVREWTLFLPATAVAVVNAIAHVIAPVTALRPTIKWPNDVQLNEKKVAGILLKSHVTGGATASLVVGIGVNVNMVEVPAPLRETATSLRLETGVSIDRTELVQTLIHAMATQYERLEKGDRAACLQTFREGCTTLKRRVRVDTPDQTYDGMAEAVEPDGSIRLRMGDGHTRSVPLSEVVRLR